MLISCLEDDYIVLEPKLNLSVFYGSGLETENLLRGNHLVGSRVETMRYFEDCHQQWMV